MTRMKRQRFTTLVKNNLNIKTLMIKFIVKTIIIILVNTCM